MNEFSRRFVEALRHAGHSAVRAMSEQAVEDHGGMRVSGRSPSGHKFDLTTASGNEVTIGLGHYWHTHLSGDSDAEAISQAITLLVELVRGQATVVELYDARGYAGSYVRRHGARSRETLAGCRRVNVTWA